MYRSINFIFYNFLSFTFSYYLHIIKTGILQERILQTSDFLNLFCILFNCQWQGFIVHFQQRVRECPNYGGSDLASPGQFSQAPA